MTARLLRACQALEAAITAAGSSSSGNAPLKAARGVLRRVRHLQLVLTPPEPPPPPAAPAELVLEPVSEVRLVKPVEAQAEPETDSSWDPDSLEDQLEASRSRALLLEIVRRAIYDWVLYRGHHRLEFREIAADAYIWLFEEEEGHPWWRQRADEERMVTSLVSICDILDIEPKTIRARAKEMDVKTILSVGRPPETRHRRAQDDADYQEHSVIDQSIDLYSLDQDTGGPMSFYESYFSNSYTS